MPTMDKLNEDIIKTKEKLNQLKKAKRAKEKRASKKQKDIDDRRKYILGGLAVKYCPELLELQPPQTRAEEYIVFAPWANFLSCLFAKKDWVAQLKDEARQKTETMLKEREAAQNSAEN